MISVITNGGRKKTDVLEHSGLLQIDIDKVGSKEAPDVRDRIGEDRHILAAWISPSGDGVKAIMLIPASIEHHKAAFSVAADYMWEKYGQEIDRACSDVNRPCYVSHDPGLVENLGAVPLKVCVPTARAKTVKKANEQPGGDSATSYVLHNNHVLHNKPALKHQIFSDFEGLAVLYQKLVAKRYAKPQRGVRNNLVMKEIVPLCVFAVAPEIAAAFAEEFYKQNEDVFSDYDFKEYMHQVWNVIEGCKTTFPEHLTERECAAYELLQDEKKKTAFRIARSLSKCGSDPNFPPPIFHLAHGHLAERLGTYAMDAWRIMGELEKLGILKTEAPGVKRTKGQPGRSTVWRWLL